MTYCTPIVSPYPTVAPFKFFQHSTNQDVEVSLIDCSADLTPQQEEEAWLDSCGFHILSSSSVNGRDNLHAAFHQQFLPPVYYPQSSRQLERIVNDRHRQHSRDSTTNPFVYKYTRRQNAAVRSARRAEQIQLTRAAKESIQLIAPNQAAITSQRKIHTMNRLAQAAATFLPLSKRAAKFIRSIHPKTIKVYDRMEDIRASINAPLGTLKKVDARGGFLFNKFEDTIGFLHHTLRQCTSFLPSCVFFICIFSS